MLRALAVLSAAAATLGAATPDMAFFEVPTDGSGVITAQLAFQGGEQATCSFAYETSSTAVAPPPPAPVAAPEPAAPEAPEALLRRLDGQCAKQTDNFWTYDICLGQNIVQSHGAERYTLGRYVRTEGDTQLFEDGTFCPETSQGRQSAITFVCAGDTRVLSAEEDKTCHYLFTVGTPAVCDHPAFKGQAAAARGGPQHTRMSSNGAVIVPWVLELMQQDDGVLTCVGRALDDLRGNGQAPSDVTFTRATLELSSSSRRFGAVTGDARHAQRQPLAPTDADTALQGGKAVLSSAPAFRGTLEYVRVDGRS